MKKLLAFVLCCGIVLCLSACGTGSSGKPNDGNTESYSSQEIRKTFFDESELEDYSSSDFWLCDDSSSSTQHCYKIRFIYKSICYCWDIPYSSDELLEDHLKTVLNTDEKRKRSTFKSAVDFLTFELSTKGAESQKIDIQYDAKGSCIKDLNGQKLGTFLYDGTFKSNGDVFRKDGLSKFAKAFHTAKDRIFEETYGKLASYKDVKYDPLSHLGKHFVITGTAELDDYYNYDYRDYEGGYFCVKIIPTGGGYTDRWYIYCIRSGTNNNKLFERLKEGSARVTMVCRGYYSDSIKHEMAELVDYYY
ncbi:MAG: hypothetical protein K2N56_00035 [Oscillospiraceae bacterium]|nr:hypothetical protein [Oscillospiraceae bacterium]